MKNENDHAFNLDQSKILSFGKDLRQIKNESICRGQMIYSSECCKFPFERMENIEKLATRNTHFQTYLFVEKPFSMNPFSEIP